MPVTILALDTAGPVASCALWQDGALLAVQKRDALLDHSRTLLVLCQDMLADSGVELEDVDAFACAIGPGSFTGIRIGAAAVKGFGWTLDKPCAGVSSLLAMAHGCEEDGVYCTRITALRGEYYYAFFSRRDGLVSRLTEDAVADQAQITDQMAQWPGCRVLTDCHDAAGVAFAARDMAAKGQLTDCHALTPVYLRRPQAERLREERLRAEAAKENPQ